MRPVGFISSEIREGGVRGGRDHEMSNLAEGWRIRFFVFWGVFFWLRFLCAFLEAEEGPSGSIGVDLEAFWGAFWGRFGDLFRKSGIFKNVCFM